MQTSVLVNKPQFTKVELTITFESQYELDIFKQRMRLHDIEQQERSVNVSKCIRGSESHITYLRSRRLEEMEKENAVLSPILNSL